MGPGFSSMSPERSSKRKNKNDSDDGSVVYEDEVRRNEHRVVYRKKDKVKN